MSQKHLRSKRFVDSTVQGALVQRVIIHWVVFLGTAVAMVLVLQVVLGSPERTLAEHSQAAWKQYALFGLVLLALLPGFILDTIRMSARFAGPIHRLRQNFRAIADGQPHVPLRFRDNDFWPEVAEEFNRMMDRLGNTNQATQPTANRQKEDSQEATNTDQETVKA